ncbi:putative Serine/threonine-protein kinase ATM [Cocos nucifera]|nr:putative Serine/threonine-protein kinase ATM [Cocos nucifera]
MINRMDFSILDLDEEYESLLDNQLEAVADRSLPTEADICMDENFEMQNSSTGVSLEEVDAETICKKSFSSARDVHQISAEETRFYENELSIDSSHCCADNILQENILDFSGAVNVVQSGKCLTCDDNPGTTLEKEKVKQQDDMSMHVEPECDDSAAILVSSVDGSLLQTVPAKESQLTIYLPNKHEVHSQDETLKLGFDVQSTSKVSLVGSDASTSDTKVFSSLDLPTRTACHSILKKRRLNHPTTPDSSFKLKKMLDARAMKYLSYKSNETHSNDEVNVANNATEKALFLDHADSGTKSLSGTKDCLVHYEIDKKGCCSLTLPRCKFKNKHHHQDGPDRPVISDLSKWTRYYSSPLMIDSSTLTSKVQKSSMSDGYCSFPKSLHMKFPRGFNLPSKEQLEKKFLPFGPLDCSKTKLFFYTGAAQVVFLNQADADSAYRCVKNKNVFGHANVRFWFDEHENFRKGHETPDLSIPVDGYLSLDHKSCLKGPEALHERDQKKVCAAKTHDLSTPILANSSLNLKPCLKAPNAGQGRNGKKTCKVRFTIET